MKRTSRNLMGVAASLAVLSLSACSANLTLNTDALPASIEAEFGFPVTVDCPPDIPLQAGLVTECTVDNGQDVVLMTVTQTDDKGNVDWNIPPGQGAGS